MSTPIIESIAANLLDTINGITVVNGYNQDITAKRPRRIDYRTDSAVDLDCLIIQTVAEEIDGAIVRKTWRQHFDIMVFIFDADDSETPIDTRFNQVWSDIFKAVRVDITRGDFAYQTMIHEASFHVAPSGGMSGVLLDISVDYRTDYNDPYTKG